MENNLKEKIFKKIDSERIKPRPKWRFILKNYSIWAFGVLALGFGALAMAVIMYLLKNNNWGAYKYITESFFTFIILTMPYVWIIFLVLFILAVNYNIKHTKKGYKYPLPMIAGGAIFISIVMGAFFYKVGLGRAIDDILGEKAPSFYTKIFNRPAAMWNDPAAGRLMGLVVSKDTDGNFLLIDKDRSQWTVYVSSTRPVIGPVLEAGKPVKLLGEIEEDNIFRAFEVLPAGPGRGMFRPFEKDWRHNMSDKFRHITNDPLPGYETEDMSGPTK